MKNLFIRALSGLVFVVIMVGGILLHPLSFFAVMLLVLVGSLHEYFTITAAQRASSSFLLLRKNTLIFFYAALFVLSFFASYGQEQLSLQHDGLPTGLLSALSAIVDHHLVLTLLLPMLLFLLLLFELFARNSNPFQNLGWNTVAAFYIVVPLLLTVRVYFDYGDIFLIALFGMIWFYDSACYVSGSLFGKHKLFERISPKKTIEGLLGGIVLTLVGAYFLHALPPLQFFATWQWMLIALVVMFGATFGDLVESLLKRSLQIKDSGSIMPGHGGFLDRFDAFLFTVPFIAFLLWLFSQMQQ